MFNILHFSVMLEFFVVLLGLFVIDNNVSEINYFVSTYSGYSDWR